MAEFFATTADVHRLTGELPETADQYPAADGGAKTVEGSARRLARMIGRDMESASLDSWRRLAAWLARAQAQRIEDACDRIWSRELLPSDAPVVVAGVGRFIAVELAARRGLRWVDFADLLPAGAAEPGQIGDCAPAVAVAWLAQQQ
jgi:probable H4MPT-linked C1 transfer pathway protein